MTRFSRSAAAEVPDKHSDNAQRRTKPADKGPYSPKQVDDLYAKGAKLNPHPRGTVGDGLTDRKTRERDIRLQKPQDPIEGRPKTFEPVLKSVVVGSWLGISTYIDRIMQMSSATEPTLGHNSLKSMPL